MDRSRYKTKIAFVVKMFANRLSKVKNVRLARLNATTRFSGLRSFSTFSSKLSQINQNQDEKFVRNMSVESVSFLSLI